MIRIKRSLAAPVKLVEKGREELKASKVHYSLDIDTRDPKYLSSSYFKVYKTTGVKATLNKLFHRKCAYCETKAMPGGHFAIEHFRPKAGIKIGNKIKPPGYWWLAAVWDNLLPSCNRCNSSGKGNLFPIAGTRAKTPDCSLGAENRLLLHPCRDFPEKHLEFSKDGTVLGTTKKGKISVKILQLDRTDLTEDRKVWVKRAVELQKTKTQKVIFDHHHGKASDTSLANEIRALMELRSDEAEYACAARQMTEKAVVQIRKYLERKGIDIENFLIVQTTQPAVNDTDLSIEEKLDEILSVS